MSLDFIAGLAAGFICAALGFIWAHCATMGNRR